MRVKLIATSLISLVILGCGGGGGGGGSSTPTSSGTAEGLWSGTSSTGYGVAVLILENAETWGIYYSGSTIWGGSLWYFNRLWNNLQCNWHRFQFCNKNILIWLTNWNRSIWTNDYCFKYHYRRHSKLNIQQFL